MSTENDQDNDEGHIKSLRKAAEEGKAAQAEAARLRKENLFLRAGVDIDTKIGKMLFNSWDGEDVEALREEAIEVGAIRPGNQAASGQQTTGPADADQQQFRDGLRGGAPAGGEPASTPHPVDNALREFHEELKAGGRRTDAGYAAIDKVIVAAANGDKRVLFNQREWDEQTRASLAGRG